MIKAVKNTKKRSHRVITRSEKDTIRLAKKLAEGFEGKEVVFLVGELGAGKTVFAKGIASGLGLKDVRQVCSPTFTLVNIYKAHVPIYHVDLYRLDKDAEILDLGWEDWLDQGVVVVEWAEKVRFDPGCPFILVTIQAGPADERVITISTSIPHKRRL